MMADLKNNFLNKSEGKRNNQQCKRESPAYIADDTYNDNRNEVGGKVRESLSDQPYYHKSP